MNENEEYLHEQINMTEWIWQNEYDRMNMTDSRQEEH